MKRIAFLIIAFFALSALPALAFLPDDEELGAILQKTYGPLSSWEAEVTFPEYPGVSVNLWFNQGKWRQQWMAGDSVEAVGNGGNVVASCLEGGFAQSPMFLWVTPHPLKSWQRWGVDLTVRTFGFYSDQPCVMIGAAPDDSLAPAVYLNNEDHAPVFVRYSSPVGLTSVAYMDYRTYAGYRVPQKVVVTVGELRLECLVKWKTVKQADGEELYDRASLGHTVCVQPPAPFDFLRDTFRFPVTQ
ncbi:hypothetical protein [Pseudodesulfovibrio sediminis]|nr:hypothetical protein [Pseudodesulfovibrio sediminis]